MLRNAVGGLGAGDGEPAGLGARRGAPAERARSSPASERALVRVRELSRLHGRGAARRAVLDRVDVDVDGGEFVAVVGASGSGKSTLLHLIGGLDRPSSGSVSVAGTSLESLSESRLARFRRETIGFVFQAFQLVPELSAWENVLLPVRLAHDLGPGRRRAEELFDRLGIAPLAHRLPIDLAGGEQQRVAIARALVMRPLLVLADEPTGNLDSAAGLDVLSLLRAAVTPRRAVLMVTHDDRHAAKADRVVRLADGRIA